MVLYFKPSAVTGMTGVHFSIEMGSQKRLFFARTGTDLLYFQS
jgi:hypothetical protein